MYVLPWVLLSVGVITGTYAWATMTETGIMVLQILTYLILIYFY